MKHAELANELAAAVRACAAAGWCPAGGGNFSARAGANEILITPSGVDKARVTPEALVALRRDGSVAGGGAASAEAGLHLALYALDANIGAVMHGHSVANTVLSLEPGDALELQGYEMAKALAGIASHQARLRLPVVDNSQDMDEIAAAVREFHQRAPLPHAFLVRGHGLYAWGADIAAAHRHLQGWEFLLACMLARRQLRA